MQLDLFSNGKVTSIKIFGKNVLTDLPNVENKYIHKTMSGKPNSKLEIKISCEKTIGLAAVLHVGTTVYSTNELTNWADASNNPFQHLTLDASTTQVKLNGTDYLLIGNSGLFTKELTFIFSIPDIPYCTNVNSKGVAPINYVKLSETISPSLSNYVYSSATVNLVLNKDTSLGILKDKNTNDIKTTTPFVLEGLKYEGKTYGQETIEYKIDTYPKVCSFEIRVCFESCDECKGNSVANNLNELCTKCSALYAKVSDTVVGNEFKCFLKTDTIEKYYFDTAFGVFYRCDIKCLYCSLKAGETIASCDKCNYPVYIEKDNTKQCYTKEEYTRLYPHYYLDSVAEKYLECNVACAKCQKPADTLSTNCEKCSTGYAFYEGIGDNKNCILSKTNNDGYILMGDTYKLCNPACKVCFEPKENNCKECSDTTSFLSGTNFCTNNSEDQIVIKGEPYYKSKKDNNYYRCHPLCSSCLNGAEPLNHNCEKCIDGYVFKEEEDLNCFEIQSNTFTGYYFDQPNNIYMKCFPICEKCIKHGDEKTNNCDSCVDGYSLVFDQAGRCIMKTGVLDGYYYNADLNIFIRCYSQCSGCTNEGKITDQKCLSCKAGLFLLTLNSNCINPEPISLGKFIEDITLLLPHTDPIKPLEMSAGDYKYLLYPYTMQSSIDNNIPYLSFSDCIDVIKAYCSINDINDLLIAQIAHNTTKIASTQTDYKFYLKNGNEIDLSKLIQDKITFNATFKLVANETTINFDYAKSLSENNIDYYNPEDPFYNTLCISYSKDSRDLGLFDRRNSIFPKVTLCQPGCIYKEIIYSNYSVKCNCSFDKTVKDTRGFLSQDESGNNFILFKCYSLLGNMKFDSPIIIGSFSLLGLEVIFSLWVMFTYFIPIDSKINSLVSNPPKKTNAKELREEEKEEEEEEEENKEEEEEKDNKDNKGKKEPKNSSTLSLGDNVTQIKVTHNMKSNSKKNENSSIQNQEAIPESESTKKKSKKKEEGEMKEDGINPPEESNIKAQGDILSLKRIKMKSTVKTKEELFEKEINEKEMKENVQLFDNNFKNSKNKDNEDLKLTNKQTIHQKIEEQADSEMKENEGNNSIKGKIELIENEDYYKKKSSVKGKGINNKIEDDSSINNVMNDKPKDKRTMKPMNEKNGDSIFSSSIDLGFERTGIKLSPDEANVASFTEIEYECDSRRYWRHFFDIYLEKQMVFSLFKRDNSFYPLPFRLFMLLFNLSSLLFFNALLYSPSYLTKRLESAEAIDFMYIIINEYDKALYSALIALVLGKAYYLISCSNVSFQRLYKDGKKNSAKLLKLTRIHRLKLIGLILILFVLMAWYFSFVFLFCILYPNNVSDLLYSFIMSFVFNFVITAVTCTVISFSRFIGIDNHLK